MEKSYNRDLLRGRCQDLPAVRSKIVRVFVSSTFSDTLAERDSLIENVFPKLKDHCRQKYGLEFQYADMRWGIQSESSDNHSEVQTCLHEIDLCQKYSLATNFVVLLSHRYGSRPTPATIEASLFEQLLDVLRTNESTRDDAEIVSNWYRLDTNQIPPAYVLRPISSMLPDILSADTTIMKVADKEWKKINRRIHSCLRTAAAELLKQSKISENDYDEFFISVTEKEIVKGILNTPNANQRALCFFRQIDDIKEHLSDGKASKFIDMKSSAEGGAVIDDEAETLLNRLKYTRVPSVLRSENIFSYRVPWKADGINRRDHAEYISKFNEDFHRAIQKQIDDCIQSNKMVATHGLKHEIMEHAIQCKTYLAKFHGRTDVTEKLEKFIHNTREDRPCIIYGESGCGKTSVLAKTANEVLKWWSDRSVSVILRFLGTTPESSNICKTLFSICRHICQLYNLSMPICSDIQQLRLHFENQLFFQIPPDEYLVIILDSIDQLEIDAYDCQWLPRKFPRNVKCYLSTLPKHGNILSSLQHLLGHNPALPETTEHLFVFVPPFELATVETVYNDWLKMKKRSLTDDQRAFLRNLMGTQTQILPLYMKLMFDIVSTWHSYDIIDEAVKKLVNIDKCIEYLFNLLKKIHNEVLFSRAIIYMTACRNGISQNELEDVLSLDDDVLKSVFQHYIPPVRRVPGILWTRIRNDLEEYITEKEADNSSVIYWYHRRFIEVANAVYIAKLNAEQRCAIFQNMIDFYKETWKGKNKPFKIDNPNLVNKYGLGESEGRVEANRLITSQPVEFIDINGSVQFNRRKLNELPKFICSLSANLSIPLFADEVLFNYRFMYAKLRCSSFNDITADLQAMDLSSSYRLSSESEEIRREMKITNLIYLIVGILLEEHPENYIFEFSARILNLYGIKKHFTRLLKDFDEKGIHHWALAVPYTQFSPPGCGLIFSMRYHTASVVEIDYIEDQQITISLSNRIVVFDMGELKVYLNIGLPSIEEPYLNSTTITDISGDKSNSDDEGRFKKFSFLVNSEHHVYFVSAQGKVNFERTSKKGFAIVNMFDMNRGLCVIAENGGHTIDCWDLRNNCLFDQIKFPTSSAPIQSIQCIIYCHLIITKLADGSLHCHALKDSNTTKLIHCAALKGSIHLDFMIVIGQLLICTLNLNGTINLVFIDHQSLSRGEQLLGDQDVLKTMITFDPPIRSESLERIILPNDISTESTPKPHLDLVFILKTNSSLYWIHECSNKTISYVVIQGQYDVVHLHPLKKKYIYATRGGIIDIYKVGCFGSNPKNNAEKFKCFHKYQLFVSIDTASSGVNSINPKDETPSMFLCAQQDGSMQVYEATHARAALRNVPPIVRSNQIPTTVHLLRSLAVTLDSSKRELITWTYQHAAGIRSRRYYRDRVAILELAVAPMKTDPTMIFVLVLTNNFYIEIYSGTSLNTEPIFTFHLRSPAKVHAITDGTFAVVTNKGALYSFAQKVQQNDEVTFIQKSNAQLEIPVSSMLSAIVTLDGCEHLAALADNNQSIAIWDSEKVIYFKFSTSPLSPVISFHGYSIDGLLLLHLTDQTLLSCHIHLDEEKIQMKSCGQVNKFALQKSCLVTSAVDKNALDLRDFSSSTSRLQIPLEGECEHLCLNQLDTHIFVVLQPRMFRMYRISDGQQLAQLFLSGLVSSITADNDFVVLAMNDRRLLTLMIADPKDPSVHDKIKALPSRNIDPSDESVNRFVKDIEKRADLNSSDDEESDFEDETKGKPEFKTKIHMVTPPTGLIRLVTRLSNRNTLEKFHKDPEEFITRMNSLFSVGGNTDTKQYIDDSDSEEIEESHAPIAVQKTKSSPSSDDLQEIHQKVLQHDEEQIKGIQLANAGSGNPKVLNNYSVTSKTCSLI